MIFLIGMPGAGKTYWGNMLSKKYGFEFIDLDDYIENKEGRSIPQVFDENGEACFRELELSSLEEIVDEHKIKDTVLACGGGTPAFYNNIELMLSNGCVIYLEVPGDVLKARLQAEGDKRPLTPVNDTSADARLKKLYEERRQYYEQAHYTLPAENTTIESFDKIIEICIDRL